MRVVFQACADEKVPEVEGVMGARQTECTDGCCTPENG